MESNKQVTAVEWFAEQLGIKSGDMLAKAKAMEKEQIMDAYNKGEFNDGMNETSEQYYSETFNND